MRNRLLLLLVAALEGMLPLIAEELKPQWVEPVGSAVECFTAKKGWFADTLGPCSNFLKPDTIAIGKFFSANGAAKTIRNISAVKVEEDINLGKYIARRGDWFCVAGESQADIDSNSNASERTWIMIPSCLIMQ